jgi:hypothetical protein
VQSLNVFLVNVYKLFLFLPACRTALSMPAWQQQRRLAAAVALLPLLRKPHH